MATRCDADPQAMEKLLGALAGMGYVRQERRRYALAALARKWLLEDSSRSLHDAIVYQAIDGGYIAQMEQYVRTGAPLRIHEDMSDSDWNHYQRAMYAGGLLGGRGGAAHNRSAQCAYAARYWGWAWPISRRARERHPQVFATILDLPKRASRCALVARSDLSDRITYRVGDALAYIWAKTCMISSSTTTSFTTSTRRRIAPTRRVAQALCPGGVMAIGEVIRSSSRRKPSQVGALTDLYFALTSKAGTWSFAEIADWQRRLDWNQKEACGC